MESSLFRRFVFWSPSLVPVLSRSTAVVKAGVYQAGCAWFHGVCYLFSQRIDLVKATVYVSAVTGRDAIRVVQK